MTGDQLQEALKKQQPSDGTDAQRGNVGPGLSCILIPGEEVVFSVYDGSSLDAVQQLNERADIATSRIVEAIAVSGLPGSTWKIRTLVVRDVTRLHLPASARTARSFRFCSISWSPAYGRRVKPKVTLSAPDPEPEMLVPLRPVLIRKWRRRWLHHMIK